MNKKRVSGLILTIMLCVLTLALGTMHACLNPWSTRMEWSKTYRSGRASPISYSYMHTGDIAQTSDGGYVFAGWQNGDEWGSKDGWLAKTDSAGNLQWEKTFFGIGESYPGEDWFSSVVQTSDEGYAVAGTTSLEHQWFWLVKTDSVGNHEWSQTYEAYRDFCHAVVQTSDGGYALAGLSLHNGHGGLLLRTDTDGNETWRQYYDLFGAIVISIEAILELDGGGFALAGWGSSWSGGYQAWLGETDSSGVLLWNKTYGSPLMAEAAYGLAPTADGGYVLAGGVGDGTGWDLGVSDFFLIKTDSRGNMEWNQTYGWSGDEVAHSVVQTPDGGYTLAGYTNSTGLGSYDAWLVRTDRNGAVLWEETYGTPRDDRCYSMIQTGDGGYALAGDSIGNAWLVKVCARACGDLNDDGVVDIFDVTIIAKAFGSKPGDSSWNPLADLVQDGVIDIFDVVLCCKELNKTA